MAENPARASIEPQPTPDSTTARPPAPSDNADGSVVSPLVTSFSPPRTDVSKSIQHPVTGKPHTAEEIAALKAWALQKGKSMGMGDEDELGDVTDYVFAGALAFEDTMHMRNLIQMSRIRPLQLRRAVTVNRQQNAQACMAYLCGKVERKPCGPCSRGSGPFRECVTVDGSLLGACASCHYGGEGSRCNFHLSSKSYLS